MIFGKQFKGFFFGAEIFTIFRTYATILTSLAVAESATISSLGSIITQIHNHARLLTRFHGRDTQFLMRRQTSKKLILSFFILKRIPYNKPMQIEMSNKK